jgi:hypothetical protein
MGKDWKSTIGEYFAKNNLFRLEYLNENLFSCCEQYAKYLSEFNGVKATAGKEPFKRDYDDIFEGIQFGIILSVSIRTATKEYKDFKMSCFFNSKGHLITKSSVDYNINGFLFPDNKKDDYYIYMEEEFQEPEVVEKEYIYGLLNSRLINYIEILKLKE